MLLLLLLSCGDKDPIDTAPTVDDTSIDTSDTSIDTADTARDTSPPLADCTIAGVSPITVEAGSDDEILISLDCDGAIPTISALSIAGVDFEVPGDATEIAVTAADLLETGLHDVQLTADGTPLTGDLRVHRAKKNLLDEFEQTMVRDMGENWEELDEDPSAVFNGETVIVATNDELAEVDLDGTVLTKKSYEPPCDLTAERGICLFGANARGFVGATGTTAWWAHMELGAGEIDVQSEAEINEVWDVAQGEAALIVAGPDKSNTKLLVYDQGKVYSTDYLGDLQVAALAESGAVAISSASTLTALGQDKEGRWVFSDHAFTAMSSAAKTYAVELDSTPTDLFIQSLDVDGDGRDDQVLFVTDKDGAESLFLRRSTEAGWGEAVPMSDAASSGDQKRYRRAAWVRVGGMIMLSGRSADGEGTEGWVCEDECLKEEETFHGTGETGHFFIAPNVDTPPPFVLGGALAGPGGECDGGECAWHLVVGEEGSRVTRLRSSDGSVRFEQDGEELAVDPGAFGHALIDGELVTAPDERDWEWAVELRGDEDPTRLSSAGPLYAGSAWSMMPDSEGLTLALGDLDELAIDLLIRLRKRPDLLTSEWNELIDQSVELLVENPLAMVTPPTNGAAPWPARAEITLALETADAPIGPGLIAAVEHDTGAGCPVATLLIPITALDASLDDAVVLSTADDCADVALPIVTADLFGDGSWSAVLSDGTAISLEDGGLRYHRWRWTDALRVSAVHAADLNDDGLGDLIYRTDEGAQIWFSAGDGGAIDVVPERELPPWIWYVTARGSAPGLGQPASAIFPTSWAAILD